MSPPSVSPSWQRDSLCGFTLVEVLVAVSLLGFGLLSLAGSVTIVTRLVDRSRAAGRAAFVALRQLESVRHANLTSSAMCGASTGGSLQEGDLVGQWTSTPVGSSLRVVVVITGWHGRIQTTDTLSTTLPC